MLSFFCFGNLTKLAIEICHLTRNATAASGERKCLKGGVLTLVSQFPSVNPAMCGIKYVAARTRARAGRRRGRRGRRPCAAAAWRGAAAARAAPPPPPARARAPSRTPAAARAAAAPAPAAPGGPQGVHVVM